MTTEPEELGLPVTDPDKASELSAQYGLLLNKLLNDCNGNEISVTISALISAAFCVMVDSASSKESGVKFINACYADCMAKLDDAFARKEAAQEMLNGNDAGEPGQSSH